MRHHPIAITGMHRSGTSMITRGLHDSGLQLLGDEDDELIQPADDNPEGFWENKAIVACNDDLLEATGGSWDRPPAIPPQAVDDPRVAHVVDAASEALAGLRRHERWGFKDPRLCLTAPFWIDLEPDLRFVICVRHPLEVALSLKRRNQNSYALGLALWERYYTTALASIPPDRRIVTHYATYFSDPGGELRRLCDFAGLEPAELQIRPELRHHSGVPSLTDADVTGTLRDLYADLCREAGAPQPPEPAGDEGRVRRLVLDGLVARRHAEQRQQAIERLQEREEQFRAEHATAEADLRRRIGDLEARLREVNTRKGAAEAELRAKIRELEVRLESDSRLDSLRADTGQALRAVTEIVTRTDEKLAEIDRRTRSTASKVDAVAKRLRRRSVRRLAARLVSKVERTGRAEVVRPARAAAAHARTKSMPKAKALARRLPPSAQRALRRGRATVSGPPLRPVDVELLPRPQAPPKGPSIREWRTGYLRLVETAVAAGDRWLAVQPGSPGSVRRAGEVPGAPFPRASDGKPLADDLGHVAHLEALRYEGYRYLVVPEGSRPWFQQHVELRDHVAGRYHRVADQPDAGVVFDLRAPAAAEVRSLRTEVADAARHLAAPPAVLVWTELEVERELPGTTTFRARTGQRLPYLDRSVVIVVTDDAADLTEARRVASLAVITVAPGTNGAVEVRSVEVEGGSVAAGGPRTLVVTAVPDGDDRWRKAIEAAVAAEGAELRLTSVDGDWPGEVEGHDAVVLLEPYVLPLPGALRVAAARAVDDPVAAVAGKVLAADGRLEAAGGTVFFDRSVGLIGNGSPDVRGPWHEYVRPVCWAPGLVAVASTMWRDAPPPGGVTGRAFLREWCSDVWAVGRRVVYNPAVAAVRVAGDGGEPAVPLQESRWQRVLDLRPHRPRELSDGAWRYLLGHDDVEACRP